MFQAVDNELTKGDDSLDYYFKFSGADYGANI